jgi:hypothetical protein
MPSCKVVDKPFLSLANKPATLQQRQFALVVTILLLVGLAVAAPFANVPLAQLPVVIPTLQAMIFVNDLVTATILFTQYATIPSRALLLLASGYLFTALIVVPQALTFPGAFAPAGLLGAGTETPAWLYLFWHLGSPVAILCYACLKDKDNSRIMRQLSPTPTIYWSVTFVVILVCGLTWIAIAEDRILPAIFARNSVNNIEFNTSIVWTMTGLILVVITTAIAVLFVRRHSVLDYWLIMVLVAFAAEQIITAYLTESRFTLGFYAGRIFLLVTSLLVLILLLSEIGSLLGASLGRTCCWSVNGRTS